MAALSRERLAILRAARLPPRRNRRAPRGRVIIQLNASAARHPERRSKILGGRVFCSSVVWSSLDRQNDLLWARKNPQIGKESLRGPHQPLAARGKQRSSTSLRFAKVPPPRPSPNWLGFRRQLLFFTLNSRLSGCEGWVRLANPWSYAAENIRDSKRDAPGWA